MTGARKSDPANSAVSAVDQAVSQPAAVQNPASVVVVSQAVPTDEEIERDIKSALFEYCKALADDLDHKKGAAKKYFEVRPMGSDGQSLDEKADSDARQTFLARDFDEFYKELRTKLTALTELDIQTMARKETAVLTRFRECFEKLNANKFYNANGRPIVYWSGEKAQAKVKELEKLCDSDIPSCSVISQLGVLLKAKSKLKELSKEQRIKYRDLSDNIFKIGSALFANQQTGDAYIYFSASNKKEDHKTPFTRDNNHFKWELGVARAKLGDNRYYYVKYNHTDECWNPPKDLTNIRENPVDLVKRRGSEDKNAVDERKSVDSRRLFEILDMFRERSRSKSPTSRSSSVSSTPSPLATPVSTPQLTPTSPPASSPAELARGRRFFKSASVSVVHLPPLDLNANEPQSPAGQLPNTPTVQSPEEKPAVPSSDQTVSVTPSTPKASGRSS